MTQINIPHFHESGFKLETLNADATIRDLHKRVGARDSALLRGGEQKGSLLWLPKSDLVSKHFTTGTSLYTPQILGDNSEEEIAGIGKLQAIQTLDQLVELLGDQPFLGRYSAYFSGRFDPEEIQTRAKEIALEKLVAAAKPLCLNQIVKATRKLQAKAKADGGKKTKSSMPDRCSDIARLFASMASN